MNYPSILVAVFSLSILSACGQHQPQDEKNKSTPEAVVSQPVPDTLIPEPQKAPTDTVKAEPATKWDYSEEEDKMTSGKTKYASIDANNLLQFKFPYQGGSVATFTVRKREGKTEILLEISKGQFITHVDGGYARIRFDDGKAFEINTNIPSDYSHTALFLSPVPTILSKLKNAKKMFLETEFYEEGAMIMEFDVKGLEW